VGPDLTDMPRATACPSCGAATRPDAQWCGQCYADFRPPSLPELPVTAPITAPASASYGEPVGDPLTGPLLDLLPDVPAVPAPTAEPVVPVAEAAWPCTTCGAANPLSEPACGACGAPFLAQVRGNGPSLVLPLVGDLFALSRGQRLGVAGAAVLALVLPLALLTLLLTHSPPASTRTGSQTVPTAPAAASP
jgi:hypothetical protein